MESLSWKDVRKLNTILGWIERHAKVEFAPRGFMISLFGEILEFSAPAGWADVREGRVRIVLSNGLTEMEIPVTEMLYLVEVGGIREITEYP